ncbi:MAG: SnoaL-like domain-containing protein, partial [Bryobacteraceae bacterium]
MTVQEVGNKLVELCQQGKAMEAIKTLYSPDVVSVEAAANPNFPQEMKGLQSVAGKTKWWEENHTIHSAQCEG